MAQVCQKKKKQVHAKPNVKRKCAGRLAHPSSRFFIDLLCLETTSTGKQTKIPEKRAFNFYVKLITDYFGELFYCINRNTVKKMITIVIYRALKKLCRRFDFEACWTSSQASEATTYGTKSSTFGKSIH